MKTRIRQGSAWFVWIVTVGLAVATVSFAFLNGRHFAGKHLPALEDSFLATASLGFATVGALIASRRSNVVGWLLSLIGLRSEERRVGKEGGSRWAGGDGRK